MSRTKDLYVFDNRDYQTNYIVCDYNVYRLHRQVANI